MHSILIHHHLGLGDHFVCNGLVRTLLEQTKANRLYLPTKEHNIGTVQQMYADDSRIVCLPVTTDADVLSLPEISRVGHFFRVGFENATEKQWDVSFYRCVGLPWHIRWSKFSCNRSREGERMLESYLGISNGDRFVLIHDQASVGSIPIQVATDLRVVKVMPHTRSMLDWCGLIEKAEEVHCIDSSFIHLAQSLGVRKGIFHNNRKTTTTFTLNDSFVVMGKKSIRIVEGNPS
jgi:hypothetical protein